MTSKLSGRESEHLAKLQWSTREAERRHEFNTDVHKADTWKVEPNSGGHSNMSAGRRAGRGP